MSLKKRIILLFVVLAVAPMLVLAAFSYWHAQNLLREAVETQLMESAQAAAAELESAEARITSGMDEMVASLASSEALGRMTDSIFDQAVFIRETDEWGRVAYLAGSEPEERFRCCPEESSRLLVFERRYLEGGRGKVLGVGFWAADLVSPASPSSHQSVSIFDPAQGAVVYAADCAAVQGGGRMPGGLDHWSLVGRPENRGTFRYDQDENTRVGAYSRRAGSERLVVVTSDPVNVTASLNRLVLVYWIFVLGLGLFTSLAFSVLLGRFTKSLDELARAAEEIGTGELDPWLPLPTSGEIGKLTLAFSRMLARIRQMMSQVDQSGRLAVVGQLSAYLAHEIRNPLSSIKLNLQRLRRWTKNGSVPEFCIEPLEISLKEVERLSASVSGVLQLSRAQDSPREVVSLHDLVEEAADLLSAKFSRQGVELSLDLDAGADRVLARAGQLKSALLNLMVNALEAQPRGGRLEIRSELSRAPGMEGPFLALRLKDEGSGIPAEIRDRIFEPFFTTKTAGSGIGLAMAIQSVRDNGGELYLEPAVSKEAGAEFVAVFPLASADQVGAHDPVPTYRDLSLGWAPKSDPAPVGSEARQDVPSHLMTPEGLRAVLALSLPESEEVN